MQILCLVIAIVLFVLTAFGIAVTHSVQIVPLALAFFAASFFPWGNWPSRP